jgi:ferritin-like metal-binding protein YciE
VQNGLQDSESDLMSKVTPRSLTGWLYSGVSKGACQLKQNLLRKLYVHELKNLYSAENQLAKALHKLAKAATSPDLRMCFQNHLGLSRSGLAKILKDLGESPTGKHCKGMEALINEASRIIAEDPEPEELDVRLISAAQRADRYEMTGYGSARTYGTLLGESEAVWFLEQAQNEEKQVDTKFTKLAEAIIFEVLELEDASPIEESFRKYLEKSAVPKRRFK